MEGGYLILGGALLRPHGSRLSLDSPLPLMRLHLLAVLALLQVRLRFFCSIPFPQPNHTRTGMCVGACDRACVCARGRVMARASHRTDRDSMGGEACNRSVPVSVPNAPTTHTDNTFVCNVCVQRVYERTNTAHEQRIPTLCVHVRACATPTPH